MGHLWMLISGIGCLLLGLSVQGFVTKVESPGNRHLVFSNLYYSVLKNEFKANLATSPLGTYDLLQMLSVGPELDHVTFQELNRSLVLPEDLNEFDRSHKMVKELLKPEFEDPALVIRNLMYVDETAKIEENFYPKLNGVFYATCRSIDFRDTRKATKKINNDVRRFTRGKITDKISSEAINGETSMIFVNILYFKGKWKTILPEQITILGSFQKDGEYLENIPTMLVTNYFTRFHDDEMKAWIVEVPYENKDFSMIIILPDVGTSLEKVESKLHLPTLWRKLAKSQKERRERIRLLVPKFKIEATLDLKPILQKMGINSLFTKTAHLSGITSKYDAHVSHIEQKISFEMNEGSDEAVSGGSGPSEFIQPFNTRQMDVNRPFLAILRYKDLDIFMARVTDPLV